MPDPNGELRLAHSSDLHVDDGYTMRAWNGDGNGPLAAVIDAARSASADILLLTGDIFEHNRLKDDILSRTRSLLLEAPMPVVMLPGNHDPLMTESVWYRGGLAGLPDIHILGQAADVITFPEYDLQIWGRAHRDYGDMAPLSGSPARSARNHVVAAHGHYVDELPEDRIQRASWLMTAAEIDATGADYVALGHWNVPTEVGAGRVPAQYSGSPDYAKTINLVGFERGGRVRIERIAVQGAPDG